MLKFFSRMQRFRNFVLLAFVVLMAISLVFFYAPSRNAAIREPTRSTEAVARVGKDDITVSELATLKETYQQMFGGQFSMAQFGGDRRLLDGLIRSRVISQEAARLGLAASDGEVADMIRKTFKDASGKFVGFDRYRESVTSRYGSVDRYEAQVRDQIAAQKLEAYVTSALRVSDEEVQDDYKRRNTTFDLTYVPVTADKLASKIQPADNDLRAYYEAHKTDFRILEPQKKIRYVFIDQTKTGEKLQISDADLQAEYDKLTPENKQGGVRVQQIVLKVARPDLDETVRAKADELVQKARGESGNATAEAFAELARGNSEDPATAKNGGTIEGVIRKNPNKPDDPLQSTLTMQEGTISEPIKYGNAYYIFRRGEAVPKTFPDARQELLVSLRNRRSYADAAQLASRAADLLKQSKDPAKVAQELATEANMSAANMVRETGFVKPGDDVPEVGSSPQFEEAIKPLEQTNEVGDRVSIKNGFAIPMLVDKREPRIPDYDEVKDKVAEAVRQEQAKSRLEQAARELATSANSPADLKGAAERLGLQAQTMNDYKLGAPLGEAGTGPVLDEAIYNLKAGEVTKTPIKVNDKWVVLGASKRTDADLAAFAKERDNLKQSMLASRRSQIFEDYVSAVQDRLQRDGQIKIYDDVLAKLTEDEPPAASPFPPRGGGNRPRIPASR